MSKLLIVDDERNVLYSFQTALESDDLAVVTAETARQGIEMVRTEQPDAVVLDVRLPDMSGLEAFGQIRQIDPRLPVIVVTAFTTTETAIEAMRQGAYEYLLKPVNFRQLRDVVRKAVEVSRLSRIPAVISANDSPEPGADRIVGQSPGMQAVYKAVGRVAAQDVTVLIEGESGTGKELVARAIYHYSVRQHMPFLAINCAAIPETLLESELFGHERGAFTGAESRRPGKFEQADGGTIFLDEIADMTPATQAKVLRVLQEQRFERIGSSETIQTDVRVIAATNQNLEAAVAVGRFRQDLFYRLNGFTIHLPPLRDRIDDLPLLVEHFVRIFQHQLGRRVRMITPAAHNLIRSYGWPGNVRELQSAIRYAIVHAAGEILTDDCLPDYLRHPGAGLSELLRADGGEAGDYLRPTTTMSPTFRAPHAGADASREDNACDDGSWAAAGAAVRLPAVDEARLRQYVQPLLRDGQGDIHRRVHAEVDRVLLDEVLRHAHGSQLEAAEILGISRTTLRARLRALGLSVEKHVTPDSSDGEHDA
jgi:two-component system nitrogen regulation response regulator GlnG